MRSEEIRRAGQPGDFDCPRTAKLEAMYCQQDKRTANELKDHIQACPSCQPEVERLAEKYTVEKGNWGKTLAYGAAAAACFFGARSLSHFG